MDFHWYSDSVAFFLSFFNEFGKMGAIRIDEFRKTNPLMKFRDSLKTGG